VVGQAGLELELGQVVDLGLDLDLGLGRHHVFD
jgi:hypothetical protein